jgi:hypothetical protein
MSPRAVLDAVEKKKSLAPNRNQTPVIQPTAQYYTDWAILVHVFTGMKTINIRVIRLDFDHEHNFKIYLVFIKFKNLKDTIMHICIYLYYYPLLCQDRH